MQKPVGWRIALTLAVLVGSIVAYWWRGHEALKKSAPRAAESDRRRRHSATA